MIELQITQGTVVQKGGLLSNIVIPSLTEKTDQLSSSRRRELITEILAGIALRMVSQLSWKQKMKNKLTPNSPALPNCNAPRVVLYARVSSDEMAKSNYNSCQFQIEELEKFCAANGYKVIEAIKDEGFSGVNLNRPGLTRVRQLVDEGTVDFVYSTWYDRFVRTREFYQLDGDFRRKNVRFKTIHDATNTDTASGRFTESLLVAVKTLEREQTSEKIRTKKLQRAEKGMWNGGKVPFGFVATDKGGAIVPDIGKKTLVEQVFRIYMEAESDTKVRQWLEANQIPAHSGSAHWQVSSITKILTNRRYIGQIELNRENKGLIGVPDEAKYRIIDAPHPPIIDIDLFETAQGIRNRSAEDSPNRVGRPRSFSQTQCNRCYPLQGILYCKHCGHSMTPYYVRHKAGTEKNGKKRKTDSFITYYACAKQFKGWKSCDHRNCISASKTEKWVLELIAHFLNQEALLDEVVEVAGRKAQSELGPAFEALKQNSQALRSLVIAEEKLLHLATNSDISPDLLHILNGRAIKIRGEKSQLELERVRLQSVVSSQQVNLDVEKLRSTLRDFETLIANAQPEELQQLLKLLVLRIDCQKMVAIT
ncbi:recombinase family protein [bacterium]|nr:MAG: recombinase family protein [bacterium]